MFTRRISFLFLVFICTTLAMGCAGENQPARTPIRVDITDANCLGRAEETIVKYFKAQSSKKEVTQFWSCLRGAIGTFLRIVRGEENNSYYKAVELRNFIETYYLGRKIHLSDLFLAEFMEIKRLFLGGGVERVSRHELTHLY